MANECGKGEQSEVGSGYSEEQRDPLRLLPALALARVRGGSYAVRARSPGVAGDRAERPFLTSLLDPATGPLLRRFGALSSLLLASGSEVPRFFFFKALSDGAFFFDPPLDGFFFFLNVVLASSPAASTPDPRAAFASVIKLAPICEASFAPAK